MLVVQVPVLVVLLVVLLHPLVRPQASWWRVQLLLGVINPLGRDANAESETSERRKEARREKDQVIEENAKISKLTLQKIRGDK